MKIIFSPEYSGHVFTRMDESGVMMDTLVVNTAGLVNMLELRLGLHYEEESEAERMAKYYEATCKYMNICPDNVMAKSFKTAGLNTSKAMLEWRDGLKSAGWKFDGADISSRLAVLVGVEEYFHDMTCKDMSDRMEILMEKIAAVDFDYSEMQIVLSVKREWLKPSVAKLIDVLEMHGANVEHINESEDKHNNISKVRTMICQGEGGKIKLNERDKSLLIYKFPDEKTACEYMSYKEFEKTDVWINADNKQMDNWLMLMGKPLTGSIAADCSPQLTQLFVMGIGMFANPLNVNTLIEWLNMPVHPIDKYSRHKLADAVVTECGYRNDACRKIIEDYVRGEFVYLDDEQKALPEAEQQKIREADRTKRKRLAEIFLPSTERKLEIDVKEVQEFVIELASWSRQHAHLISTDNDSVQWVEQLMTVATMCDAMNILLCTVTTQTIDYKTLDSWMSTIYQKSSYTNAVAEKGSRMVVDSPAKIASVVNNCIWMGVDGDTSKRLECSFLYPSEKEGLENSNYIHSWRKEYEASHYEEMMLTPLRMTSESLILVTCERRGGEPTQKHPLIVRLEQQVENLDKFVICPEIKPSEMKMTNPVFHESPDPEHPELTFEHADKIKWPDHLSPTNISTLVEFPFDFMMADLLGITSVGTAKMADVKTTKGNVAHAVIEALFAPRCGEHSAKPEEIAERIDKEYDQVYLDIVEAKGALLQLAENKLGEKLLHEQLRYCLEILLEILKANDLKVTGCERGVRADMKLGLPAAYDTDGNRKERDVTGYIDMTLEDADGHPVVFDFKWTGSKYYHQGLLAENRSIQLELYRMMLGKEERDQVKRVAYFLMPEGRLYSREDFKGRYSIKVESENHDEIVTQLRNSILYRKNQINNGVVENGGYLSELQYVKDTENENLFPLKGEENDQKELNMFSYYGLFN